MYVTCADGLHLHAVVVQVGAALLAGDARFLEAKEGKIHLASNSMQCGKRFLSGDRAQRVDGNALSLVPREKRPAVCDPLHTAAYQAIYRISL